MDNFEGTTAFDQGLLTTDRFKELCRKRNIKVSGRTEELVERFSAEIKLLTYKFYPKQQIKEVYN